MKIIAVDDEVGSGKLLEKSISSVVPDADLKLFSDPIEALEESKTFSPDVAFLDVNMPNMSGLDLAKHLLKINPKINVIFVTGYSEYATDAFGMHASGYLTKPVSPRDVKTELGNLRNPVSDEVKKHDIYVKTFGNFELIVDGKRVKFQRALAKEMFAYMIDRDCTGVTRKELAAVLFEDKEYSRSNQSYMSQIINSLTTTLKAEDIYYILDFSYNSYSLKKDCFRCDAYEYLEGDKEAKKLFQGEYMSQFSWGEESIGKFFTDDYFG